MDDLVQFLRERLDEDEQTAGAASPGPWHPSDESDEVLAVDGITVADGFALSGRQLRATTEHIARHDPARVLAEVEAKRRMLEALFGEGHAALRPGGSTEIYCGADYGPDNPCDCGRDERVGRSLRILAAVYADHPGFDPSWLED